MRDDDDDDGDHEREERVTLPLAAHAALTAGPTGGTWVRGNPSKGATLNRTRVENAKAWVTVDERDVYLLLLELARMVCAGRLCHLGVALLLPVVVVPEVGPEHVVHPPERRRVAADLERARCQQGTTGE